MSPKTRFESFIWYDVRDTFFLLRLLGGIRCLSLSLYRLHLFHPFLFLSPIKILFCQPPIAVVVVQAQFSITCDLNSFFIPLIHRRRRKKSQNLFKCFQRSYNNSSSSSNSVFARTNKNKNNDDNANGRWQRRPRERDRERERER